MRPNYQTLIIIAISVMIPIVVVAMFFTGGSQNLPDWISILPAFHASVNAISCITLILGYYFIKKKRVLRHKQMMLTSFTLGCLFLISYVTYHSNAPSTVFGGDGWIRIVYYFILISHILLAIIVVPLVLFALYHALGNNILKHRRIVKYTWPIWLYVSISGVLVYLMISPYY